MRKGDIYLVEIPVSGGHEQYGLRPAIILSKVIAGTVVVIPLTANSEALRFDHTVLINPSKGNKLNTPSVALVFQIRAIDTRRMGKPMGRIDAKNLRLIDKLIKSMLLIK